jgi:hypothetical protein
VNIVLGNGRCDAIDMCYCHFASDREFVLSRMDSFAVYTRKTEVKDCVFEQVEAD